MAVYKPSNCRPFLNSVDLTRDVNVQCEINTSNQDITGYKLQLLNSLNDVIFAGSEYTFIRNLESNKFKTNIQTGVNGTLLTVPLIIAENPVNNDESKGVIREPNTYPRWEYVDSNNIYYIPDEGGALGGYHYFKRKVPATEANKKIFNSTTAEPVLNLSNGNANMPYKWQITLAQSQLNKQTDTLTQLPPNDWAYDIMVSTGQILGSNYQRIQSNLSDNIYRDYYIQLQNNSGVAIGSRVRISSYDRTFGYIYPQEGFITEEDFQQATQFVIYKDTNNPSYVSAGRTVQYAITQSVESGDWWQAFASEGDVKPANFDVGKLASRGNKYYYDMSVVGVTQNQYRNFNSRALSLQEVFADTPGGVNGSTVVFSSTRFLFMRQGTEPTNPGESGTEEQKEQYNKYTSNPYKSTYDPLNGVWVLIGASDFKKDTNLENQLESNVQSAKTALANAKQAQKDLPSDASQEDKDNAQQAVDNATTALTNAETALSQFRDDPSGSCYIRWQRPNDANTWANYIGRNWFVVDGFIGSIPQGSDATYFQSQLNVGSNAVAGASGVINTSPLSFFPEEAVVIYPKNNNVPTDAKGIDVTQGGTVAATDTIGIIFNNAKDGSKVYVKPFVGLQDGMRINWSNAVGQLFYANISNIDRNYWSVKLTDNSGNLIPTANTGVITTPGTQYKITSFFKTSDENPFYAYSTPTLVIQLKDANGNLQPFDDIVPELDTYPYAPYLNSRYLEVWGGYEQAEHISWKRFRWLLEDISVNNTQATENTYDGVITYFFDALQDNHKYRLTLEVEDEQGFVQTVSNEFIVSLRNLGSGEAFPLEVTFDCATQSVDINFIRNGIIVPDYYNSTIYDDMIYEGSGDYDPANNGHLNEDDPNIGVAYSNGEVKIPNQRTIVYENTKALVVGATQEEDTYVDAKLSSPVQNNITFNSAHTDINEYFIGELFEIEINLNDESNKERVKIGALLPPDTVPSSGKTKPNGVIPNIARNQILINYWSEQRGETEEEWRSVGLIFGASIPVQFYGVDGVSANEAVSYWRTGYPIVYSYQIPGFTPNVKFDYLPITYYDPSDINQIADIVRDSNGNITSATYLKINGEDVKTFPTSATPDGLVYYYLKSDEINSSVATVAFPLNSHSYGYRVSVGSQGNAEKQDFDVLITENPDAQTGDNSPRELYQVREVGEEGDTTTLTIWQDEVTYLATQIDGTQTLMKAKTYTEAMKDNGFFVQNVWHDFRTNNGNPPSSQSDMDNTANIWDDNCALSPSYYKSENVNAITNHTGRQEINGLNGSQLVREYTFNVALQNFDSTKTSFSEQAELTASAWITTKPKS